MALLLPGITAKFHVKYKLKSPTRTACGLSQLCEQLLDVSKFAMRDFQGNCNENCHSNALLLGSITVERNNFQSDDAQTLARTLSECANNFVI